jgi:hypothetical protein
MPAAGVVLIIAVVLIIGALAVYLLPTIAALIQITKGLDEAITGVGELIQKSAPVNPVVEDINSNLDVAVSALEGLLVKKAGLPDAMGLIDGLYTGAAAEGLRDFAESKTVKPPRISEVYTRGTLTLARLGREAPIAAASPEGPVLRHVTRSEIATNALYPDLRQTSPEKLPRSPVIGADSPVQYEEALTPGVRAHMPHSGAAVLDRPTGGVGDGSSGKPEAGESKRGGLLRWKGTDMKSDRGRS